jgi:hypothetical protein
MKMNNKYAVNESTRLFGYKASRDKAAADLVALIDLWTPYSRDLRNASRQC